MKCQILTNRNKSWSFNSPTKKYIEMEYFQLHDLLKYLNFEIYKNNTKKKVGKYIIISNTAFDEYGMKIKFDRHYLHFEYSFKELNRLTKGEIKTRNDILEYSTQFEKIPPVIDDLEMEYEKKHFIKDIQSYFIDRIMKRIDYSTGNSQYKQLIKLKLRELNNLYLTLYNNVFEKVSFNAKDIKEYKRIKNQRKPKKTSTFIM